MARIGGILFIKVDGVQLKAKGAFTYGLGNEKREMVIGADGVHGYKEMPQSAYIEGAVTDAEDLDVHALMAITEADVIAELANGKTIAFDRSVFTSEGAITTEEGEIAVRFDSSSKAREL